MLFFGFLLVGQDVIITNIHSISEFVREHRNIAILILFIWSSILFLTLAPLGSFTILIAGFLLGSGAGWIQFLSIIFSTIILILVFDQKPTKPYCTSDLPEFAHKTLSLVTGRPFLTSSALRLIPVVPSCACVLICLELNISKANICAGTIAFGWLRPVLLAIIGSHIPTIADLLLKVT